ncbi:MAG TPA: cytochrome c peroxidase [Chitinophagaceae bacterium]|nr:cytochrome c peroxidase [Chitinophagaceae bacterium]
MNRRNSIAITLFVCLILLIQFSCQEPINGDDPVPVPGPVPGAPKLPPTPFDYAAGATMPTHIRNYINAHPDVDNTPGNNPITNHGATLGRVLFYDKSLSVNNTIACASCHHQDKAFTDGLNVSKGFDGGVTRRNAMAIVNVRYFKAQKMFWDLRAATLEEQSLMPITDHIEMGMPSLSVLETKLKGKAYYPALFKNAFGTEDITDDRIAKALSQFMRSIVTFNSKYDQGLGNNFANFSTEELRGKQLMTQLNCTECHSDLTNVASRLEPTFIIVENSGVNTGFGANNALDLNYADNGIGEKTGLAKDMGTFKMPTLRNIALTAPYMHDGRFSTLEQVMDHYQNGAKNHPNRGVQIPNGGYQFITAADKAAIVAFLKTLTDQSLVTDPKYSDPFK